MTPLDRLKARGSQLLVDPYWLRDRVRGVIRERGIGSYAWRVQVGAVERPAYAHCVRAAARLARRLGVPAISVVEFGVAGGNGLLALEDHARRLGEASGVRIDVYGFDTGRGLPPSTDYRDVPYHWQGGFFPMDEAALRERLSSATLVLGDVEETVATFTERHDPAPIGAVVHDLDLYSSTVAALRLFDAPHRHRMPRIYNYFDDIIGSETACMNDHTGERLAIAEFNADRKDQKIAPAHYLSTRATALWHHQVFVTHDFAHPRYNDYVSNLAGRLPLEEDPAGRRG